MQMMLVPTEEFFKAGGVMLRAWRGADQNGAPVIAFVACVLVDDGQSHPDGLISIPPPTAEAARMWAAEVLSRRYDDDET